MELEGGSGSVYRLVLRLDDDECVFDAPAFAHYKQARAQIAAAVCRHARHGAIRQVLLQRCDMPRNGAARPASVRLLNNDDGLSWSVVGQWENDVIHRILRQNGFTPPTSARPTDLPPDETPAALANVAADQLPSTAAPLRSRPGNGVDKRVRREPPSASAITQGPTLAVAESPTSPANEDTPPPHADLDAGPDAVATIAAPAEEPPPATPATIGADEHAETILELVTIAPAGGVPMSPNGALANAAACEAVDADIPVLTVDAPEPAEVAEAAATPEPSIQPHKSTRRHKTTAWQLPLTILLLVIVWLTFAVLQTGGHPLDLLRFTDAPAISVAEDLRPIGPPTASSSAALTGTQPATLPADAR